MKQVAAGGRDQKWKRRSDEDAQRAPEVNCFLASCTQVPVGRRTIRAISEMIPEFQNKLDQNRRPVNFLIQAARSMLEDQV